MTTSNQTKADLATIIETLDQRIHELNTPPSTRTSEEAVEAGKLKALREQAFSLVSAA